MLQLYLYTQLFITPHVPICLDYSQGVTEHKYSIHKNIDELLNTLKFVHKKSADITKFVWGRLELVHKVRIL